MTGRRATALALLVTLASVTLVRCTVVAPVRIASTSMSPTLHRGDVVLVSRLRPALRDLRRDDVVVVQPPGHHRRALKRVVGLPGERLVVLDGRLVVDGVVLDEPFVDHDGVDGYYSATVDVPPDAVFVMGDNRGNSVDSRDYGPVPVRDIRGRLVLRLR